MKVQSHAGKHGTLDAAKEVFSRKVFPPESVIFRQGDSADHAYMIMRGEVDIVATNVRGKQVRLLTMSKGQVFGDMALMVKGPRSASAITKTECELMLVKASQLEKKLQDTDPLMRLWVETLAERIVATTARVE